MLVATVLKDVHQKLSKEQFSPTNFLRIDCRVTAVFQLMEPQVHLWGSRCLEPTTLKEVVVKEEV